MGLTFDWCDCGVGLFQVSFLRKDNGSRTKKKAIMIGLELPAGAKLSWWRLVGYGTRPNSASEAEDDGESESESESGHASSEE